MRKKAEIAQHPEIVLRDPRVGVADEPHRAACNILQSADKIDDLALLPRIKRIDGEIPPLGVDLPVTAKIDLGSAAIGLGIMAERGDLETAARRSPA
jgi:hypothetical protein